MFESSLVFTAMAGIFPGACDLETYWENIAQAKVSPLSSLEERWGIPRVWYFDPKPGQSGRIYLDHAFCLPWEQSGSEHHSTRSGYLKSGHAG